MKKQHTLMLANRANLALTALLSISSITLFGAATQVNPLISPIQISFAHADIGVKWKFMDAEKTEAIKKQFENMAFDANAGKIITYELESIRLRARDKKGDFGPFVILDRTYPYKSLTDILNALDSGTYSPKSRI